MGQFIKKKKSKFYRSVSEAIDDAELGGILKQYKKLSLTSSKKFWESLKR